jgi:1,4-dihydroxy-2-naphthoate octaprenyltransferase
MASPAATSNPSTPETTPETSGRLRSWGEILRTQNLSPGREMDFVSRWLLITRASVFPMTLTSGAIGGLLALGGPHAANASLASFLLALLGLVLAHAANNMINDYFDLAGGVDSEDYVRGQYAPHPILSGLISKGGLLLAIAVVNALDLGILWWLALEHGWPIVAFALAGLAISVFYVAPPLQLKHHGLGEPGVFVVWGPLMIGGTYYATTGAIEPWVLVASLPYALLVTTVLIGKHIDKFEADSAKGIHTLPVLLGADRSRFLNQFLMVSFFALVLCLALVGALSAWTLLVFLGLPRLVRVMRVMGQPKPSAPPENYPIWPLWYVAWAFLFTRFAGVLFLAGLVLDTFWRLRI